MKNNMTKEQIDRYLDILEENNRIANRTEELDLQQATSIAFYDIAVALKEIAYAIEK